ncbi:CD15/CS22/SEF14 family fimbrial major subunit [Escherichia coli]
MRKLPIAILAAAVFSVNTYAATLTGSSVDVDASVDVAAPTTLSASWTPVTGLVAGTHPDNMAIGNLSVANLGSAYGWVVFTNAGSGDSVFEGNTAHYIFRNDDGSTIKSYVSILDYPGVKHGEGTGIGKGPSTFIPSQYSNVNFKLAGEQQMNAGTYRATLSVSAYNN